MKPLIRIFFRAVRLVLTPLMLLADRLTTPKGMIRNSDQQAQIDQETIAMAIYHFPTCPFCIKTRRAIKRLSLNIELRDTQHDPDFRQQLLAGGGKLQVPCLKVENKVGPSEWLYESTQIIGYLRQRFDA